MNTPLTPLKIAIAGLGTVGGGVVRLLHEQADLLSRRAGRPLKLVAVADRNPGIRDQLPLDGVEWFDDGLRMVAESPCDVVVELIGGAGGIAHKVVETAFEQGRSVVTANKALLAHQGVALAHIAEAKGLTLGYEAAVAGGIPIIKALREGLVGNRISRLYGIMNGTCNYILTAMRETGRDFADVLAEAQDLGYAEADPSFDVDGIDTAHKLALLAAIGVQMPVAFKDVYVEGIRKITAADLKFAGQLGYRIKLLGIVQTGEHGVEQRVHPCMVAENSPIAHVDGVFNAVVAQGDFVDRSVYEGRGAGAGPTASAVVSDLVDIARGHHVPTFGVPVTALQETPVAPMDKRFGAYYLRLMVTDRPGVLADVAATLRDEGVSVEQMIQPARSEGQPVPMVMTTHDALEAAMNRAVSRIAALDAVVEPPHIIRIERF